MRCAMAWRKARGTPESSGVAARCCVRWIDGCLTEGHGEERIAVGLRQDAVDRAGRVDAKQALELRAVESRQPEVEHLGLLAQMPQGLAQWQMRRGRAGAVGADDQQTGSGGAEGDMPEEVERRRLRPVQIFQHQ